MAVRDYFDVFIGGQTGTFKGVGINFADVNTKPTSKNIQSIKVLNKTSEITSLGWGDPYEVEVLVGLACQTVKIYDSDLKGFTTCLEVRLGHGKIRGISRYKETLLTAVESGHVKIWTYSSDSFLDTGKPLEKMKHNSVNSDVIATGGKDNDLRLWNLEKKICTFAAKNVRPDMLQLEVPVWVSDMDFLPNTSKVALCTRHGHVRLYDPSTPQRRPVISMDIPDESLTALTVASNDHHVIVGSGKGKLMLIDLRKKGSVVQHYRGAVGGIRSVVCHKTEPYIVSGGLDGHLLVHHLNSKALLHKVYMKTCLNCILLRSDAIYKFKETECQKKENLNDFQKESSDDDDVQILEDDYDDLFNRMETIEEPSPKKKRKKS